MLQKLNIQNGIITRQNDGLVYCSPAHIPHIASCNISTCSKVRIKRMSTRFTLNKTRMSNSIPVMTPVTFFRGVSRINIDHFNSLSKCFIFDKVLELSESPLVNPFIVSGGCPDVFQIFHNNHISFSQSRNNRPADIVIRPTHKPIPVSRKFFEFSSGCSGAFGLEFTNKPISFNSQGFYILSIEFIVGSDSEFINSQVNSKNPTMLVRIYGVFLGECKSEVMFFFGLSQKTFNNLPIFKIFQSIIRDFNRNFNFPINGRNTQNVILERETSRGIISNRSSFDKWLGLGFFKNPTSHFNTGSRKLSRKSNFSKFRINKRVEFNIIFDSQFPTILNTILKSLFIEINSINYNFINFNFNRNASNQHCKDIGNSPFINFSHHSRVVIFNELNGNGIPPTDEAVGILPNVL